MRLNRRGYVEGEELPGGFKTPILPGDIPPGFIDPNIHDPFYPVDLDDPNYPDAPGPDYPSKPRYPVYNPGPEPEVPWWYPLLPDLTPSSPDPLPPYLNPANIPDWLRKLFER